MFGLYISSMECVRPSSVPEILTSLAEKRETQFYAELKYDGERFVLTCYKENPSVSFQNVECKFMCEEMRPTRFVFSVNQEGIAPSIG